MTTESFAQVLSQPPIWLAALCAAGFAAAAWSALWLTVSGAASTFVVGLVVFGLGGGRFMVPLLIFFVSSSLLSRLARTRKPPGTTQNSARDAGQVWANGGAATAIVLAFAAVAHRWPIDATRYLLMLYLAALATVNSDTWATEIGSLSRRAPRLVGNWRVVAPGTSGAVSALGIAAALCGAAVIPLSMLSLWRLSWAEFAAVAWAGFLGGLADSVFGAGLQAQYLDDRTGDLRDAPGEYDRGPVRGLSWVNNDVVNLFASLCGVLCAWALLRYGAYPYR